MAVEDVQRSMKLPDVVPAPAQLRDAVVAGVGAHPGRQFLSVRAQIGREVAGLTPSRTSPQGVDPRAGVGVLDPAGAIRTLRIAGAGATSGRQPGEPPPGARDAMTSGA